MICFVSSLKPFSIQSDGCKKYKERLAKEFNDNFKSIYPQIPLNESIYSKIIYIHSKKTDIDVDNMSKPFVDAFRGIIYIDDNIINHRVCTKIMLEDFETYEISIESLPDEIAEKLNELIENGSEHIVYYEIGKFSKNMIYIGDDSK